MSKETPRTLILTPIMPSPAGVGESFLYEICKIIPQDKLSIFLARSTIFGLTSETTALKSVPFEQFDLPSQEGLNFLGKTPTLFDHCKARAKRRKNWSSLEPLTDAIVEFSRKNKVERIFVVLVEPALIMVAERVGELLSIPVTALVWDPPQTTMMYLGYDKYTSKLVMESFYKLLKSCQKVGVASPNMADYYKAELGIESLPLIKPLDPSQLLPAKNIDVSEPIRIGFSGSIYAVEEMRALLSALKETDWRISGRDVVLRIMSSYFSMPIDFSGKSANIELMGFRSLPETIQKLAECSITYLPYWINPNFTLSAKTCFPDKLGTYLSAGVPILFHGPDYAMPSSVISKYGIGAVVHNHESKPILDAITTLADLKSNQVYSAGRLELMRDFYDKEKFRERIEDLLGLSISTKEIVPKATVVAK